MQRSFLLATIALLAPAAGAQSFNLDCGHPTWHGVPSDAYGAAAAQRGYWNPITYSDVTSGLPLSDLDGSPTGVTVRLYSHAYYGPHNYQWDIPTTTGDDDLLMDDDIEIGYMYIGDEWMRFDFTGLEPAYYDVYVYSLDPGLTGDTHLSADFPGTGTVVGGWCSSNSWPGQHVEGKTYRRMCGQVPATGGTVQVWIRLYYDGHFGDWGSCNGIQLVKRDGPCGDPGTRYCYGEPAAGTPCPCGNDNDASLRGAGCANGVFPSGARLDGYGVASVSSDTVQLIARHVEPYNFALFFQGNNAIDFGVPWGDGLRCAGGGEKRLEARVSDEEGTAYTTISISTKAGLSAGDHKHYQCWYRNPQGSPCSYQFNLTNGVSLLWTP